MQKAGWSDTPAHDREILRFAQDVLQPIFVYATENPSAKQRADYNPGIVAKKLDACSKLEGSMPKMQGLFGRWLQLKVRHMPAHAAGGDGP